jgi:23S rRNA (cytidine2498-2'-O)-methyltransferase
VIDFAFASCLPGIERAVKLDVARRRPELRFAFSRPGLCTFKSDRAVAPDDPPGTVFARVWGRSLGPANDQAAAVRSLAGSGVNRVHVFARDPEAALDLDPWRAGLETIAPVGRASAGELVADVIVAEGEPSFLGLHRADGDHLPEPGGAIPIEMPPDAPSRAYAKIEEAIAWLGLPLAAGQTAVELGSAPGGAALALARRGIEVWGVDPAAMAPHVLACITLRPRSARCGGSSCPSSSTGCSAT